MSARARYSTSVLVHDTVYCQEIKLVSATARYSASVLDLDTVCFQEIKLELRKTPFLVAKSCELKSSTDNICSVSS